MTITQDHYIARLQQQDESVIGDLYDAYSGALYGVVLRIVQSPELAQQVLQDTFLKVWRNAAGYDSAKGRLFTWLVNIARNTAIDATRSAQFKQRQKTDSIDALVHSPGGHSLNPDHIGVREMVSRLDEKYRLLVDLMYFQGYTQEEAAEETGIPLGTVKTRLRYAIGELRRIFGETLPLILLAWLVWTLLST
ncbi:MAG: sigma-70 family RNA polymerase sigma factor [Lewinellaceae bacterium]|nr:sigma-70 family RNA polymerase sigma factor [Lewinellaceae bacterium]